MGNLDHFGPSKNPYLMNLAEIYLSAPIYHTKKNYKTFYHIGFVVRRIQWLWSQWYLTYLQIEIMQVNVFCEIEVRFSYRQQGTHLLR